MFSKYFAPTGKKSVAFYGTNFEVYVDYLSLLMCQNQEAMDGLNF
jgi:hypothetical protein